MKEVWYGRTVIKSSYKLCYEHAQEIIQGKGALKMQEVVQEFRGMQAKELETKFGEVKEALVLLSRITRRWQEKRQEEGSAQFAIRAIVVNARGRALHAQQPGSWSRSCSDPPCECQ